MGPGDLGGKVSALLSRVTSLVLVAGSFADGPPGKPGDKELGNPGRVGVVGEESNPDLNGA